ncbi:uncharacterized protein P884DRAFT_189267, partial [Thermothelomyces heterothallicus CBS 202.75]|uniref:uncharacterized protein n=1 Tax=Thermothelomyces heterothallicus CBS 202.75 TaxID=1149848 RepID=UPI0037448AA2
KRSRRKRAMRATERLAAIAARSALVYSRVSGFAAILNTIVTADGRVELRVFTE